MIKNMIFKDRTMLHYPVGVIQWITSLVEILNRYSVILEQIIFCKCYLIDLGL